MCVAIWHPVDAPKIPKQTLRRAWDGNRDGTGIAYAHESKLHVIKFLQGFKPVWRTYLDLKDKGHGLMIHFRFGTSGRKDLDNTHPFEVGPDVVMCHNGVLSGVGTRNFSDTWHLAKALEALGHYDWWQNPAWTPLLNVAMQSSKFVFLRSNGEVWLPQEEAGYWRDGTWYSNSTPFSLLKSSFYSWNDERGAPYSVDRRSGAQLPSTVVGSTDDGHELSEEVVKVWFDDGRLLCVDCVTILNHKHLAIPVDVIATGNILCEMCGTNIVWPDKEEG